MATTEALPETHDSHGHDHDHDHPAFLAHHFDTPEQQFDSGKLGMWLFLVTEILFFSGLFVAYAIFRSLRPEVFVGCSEFLNTKLGAINTGVLLFSSFTMAWAVRCAQVEEYKKLTGMLAATLSCAMVFLGVKSIEYSHKWELGLLPPAFYFYNPANPHHEGVSMYLVYLCIPFAIGLVGLVVWFLASQAKGNAFALAVAKPLIVVFAFFFVGVGLGTILESGESHDSSHDSAHVDGDHHDSGHAASDHHAAEPAASAVAHPLTGQPVIVGDSAILQRLAQDETNTGIRGDLRARERQGEVGSGRVLAAGSVAPSGAIGTLPQEVNTRSQAGVFFGIYYVMTGIHAIHILAGIGVLIWLLVRSVRQDFNRQYFGPVDYVGLYWHIVDLIWIYLFPLLYLIR
jgi:cytochrome c oxidase subunit 3